MKDTVCLMTARTGSRRIKNKNVKDFLGKPIIQYPLETVRGVNWIDKVIISTDNIEKIRNNIKDTGMPIDIIMRSDENSNDTAIIFDVFKEHIELMRDYKYCLIVYPTSNFMTPFQLIRAKEEMETNNRDVVFPVVDTMQEYNRMLYCEDGEIQFDMDHDKETANYHRAYYHAGQFFLCDIEKTYLSGSICKQSNIGMIKLNPWEAHDINTPKDWDMAELKFRILTEMDLWK